MMITTIKISRSWINITNKLYINDGSTAQSIVVYPNDGNHIDIGKYRLISAVYTPEHTTYTIERSK